MKRNIILSGFVLMAIAQWIIPARMISAKEDVLVQGKEFRFRTEPFDPYDAFRGKYIHLAFSQSYVQIHDTLEEWNYGEKIYGLISIDTNGFASIASIQREEPEEMVDYLKLSAGYVYRDSVTSVSFEFPFDRFYMEESKASAADEAYADAVRDAKKTTYALVAVYRGEAVIKDVFIDGVPIKQVAIQRQKEQEQAPTTE